MSEIDALSIIAATEDDLAAVAVLDLLGDGSACVVWSSPLPAAAEPDSSLPVPCYCGRQEFQ